MGKSLRSKVKRRYRSLKRGHLNQIVLKPTTQQLNTRCEKALVGLEYREPEKKNAFLHPEEADAQFPQYKPQKMIDLRSAYIPNSGRQWSGARKHKPDPQHVDEIPSRKEKRMAMELENLGIDAQQEEKEYVERIDEENQERKVKKRKKVSKLRKTMVF